MESLLISHVEDLEQLTSSQTAEIARIEYEMRALKGESVRLGTELRSELMRLREREEEVCVCVCVCVCVSAFVCVCVCVCVS